RRPMLRVLIALGLICSSQFATVESIRLSFPWYKPPSGSYWGGGGGFSPFGGSK
ncbi:hypothetical protein FOZ63_004915, partial [Perkinsus olseni]